MTQITPANRSFSFKSRWHALSEQWRAPLSGLDALPQPTSVDHVLDSIHNHQARLPLGNFINQLAFGTCH